MLTNQEIEFIQNNLKEDIVKLILQEQRFPNLDIKKLANQIKARKKAISKLPTFAQNTAVFFPPTIAWQQCSSEFTAKYKASLIKGKTIVDLTGGFGIDTFYLAQQFEEVTYIEQQKNLSEIVTYNNTVLNQNNIKVINNDSIAVLKKMDDIDVIYLDPARRNENERKVISLEDSFPNIIELQDDLLQKSKNIMLKTSPMLDIHQALRQLKNVTAIHVVAVENECKELVFIQSHNKKENIPIKLYCINIHRNGEKDVFETFYNNKESIEYSLPKKYIYDPNKAIHKANVFNTFGNTFGLIKIAPNTHLYTADVLIDNFQGRVFELEAILKPSKKVLKKALSNKKANLIVRNFPETVAELKKKLKIQDGGNQYLMAVTLDNRDKVILKCKRL
jgi:16S rRNA G966 N2-methylase RsmD